MKHFTTISFKQLAIAFVLLTTVLTGSLLAFDKIDPDELIAKHLDSIGTAEARAALKSITIAGTSKATFFGRGGGIAGGIAVLASEGHKYLVAMKFNSSDYQFEKMGFDAENFTVGFVSPGRRSVLGDFLQVNRKTFERGIISGVLSTAWELHDLSNDNARIKYSGTETIGDKKCHELTYNPKKGSDLSIKLFFDPDTYRHVRTEYRRSIASRQGAGGVDSSSRLSETRYKMVEDFSDFSAENNLTLPHTYKIYMEILSGNGTTSYEWEMQLEKFAFNGDIETDQFKVDAY